MSFSGKLLRRRHLEFYRFGFGMAYGCDSDRKLYFDEDICASFSPSACIQEELFPAS